MYIGIPLIVLFINMFENFIVKSLKKAVEVPHTDMFIFLHYPQECPNFKDGLAIKDDVSGCMWSENG